MVGPAEKEDSTEIDEAATEIRQLLLSCLNRLAASLSLSLSLSFSLSASFLYPHTQQQQQLQQQQQQQQLIR